VSSSDADADADADSDADATEDGCLSVGVGDILALAGRVSMEMMERQMLCRLSI
jgi:hypothetical protein